MRRLAKLVTLAALATLAPSVASAYPTDRYRYGERDYDYDRRSYNEGYYDRDGRRIDRRGWRGRRWAPIVEANSASSERQFINVLGRGGHFRRLLIEGVRGAPVIERVAVEFEDRHTQVWDLNLRFVRGADEVIDLGGPKRIHRIIVYTNPAFRGSYSIYGR